MIDFVLFFSSLKQLFYGARITVLIAGISCLIGLSLGTLYAFGQLGTNKLIRLFLNIYINIVRGTPMLIQISFFYVLLPYLGISVSPVTVAIIAIGLNSAAYLSQTIKAGILAVSKGQLEAGRVLGLSNQTIIFSIILPQALRVALPALGNEFITLIKDSSLASLIGAVELFKEGQRIIQITYDALTVYCGIALVYLCLTIPLSLLVNYLEQKFNHVKN